MDGFRFSAGWVTADFLLQKQSASFGNDSCYRVDFMFPNKHFAPLSFQKTSGVNHSQVIKELTEMICSSSGINK